ncbi:MAG: ATP-dependent DNA helicase, partial [Halanaerobiales bacterium]
MNKQKEINIRQNILKILKDEAETSGHTFLEYDGLYKNLLNVFPVESTDFQKAINVLEDQGKIKLKDNNKVYLYSYYNAEKTVAFGVKNLLAQEDKNYTGNLDDLIASEEKSRSIELVPEQREAIKSAFKNQISVIIGGSATGKTETINIISKLYKEMNPKGKIHLAAATNKAAYKLGKNIGMRATTIHELLEYDSLSDSFNYNSYQPLPGQGLLIIDDFNSCDLLLAAGIFNAIGLNYKVVLAGDINHLPNIKAGMVLRDLTFSKLVPTVELTETFPEKKARNILEIANKINDGQIPDFKNIEGINFIEINKDYEALNSIINILQNELKDEDLLNYQVITPVNYGIVGVDKLNYKIRNILNPGSNKKKELGNFRVYDKVIANINDVDKDIYNGAIGVITKVRKHDLSVKFRHLTKEVIFRREELDLLQLAYATTAHRSQGSKYSKVIMVLTKKHRRMLKRNLLYTGVTRARDELHLVVHPEAIK